MTASNPNNTSPAQAGAALLESMGSICSNLLLELQQAGHCASAELPPLVEALQSLQPILEQVAEPTTAIPTLLQLLRDHLSHFIATGASISSDDVEIASELCELCSRFLQQPSRTIPKEIAADAATLLDALSTRMMILQSEEPQASADTSAGTDSPLEVAAVSESEQATFDKYLNRAEQLFVVQLPAGACRSPDDLANHSAVDALSRVSDIFLQRLHAGGCLILLAAELDADMLSTIAGITVTPVDKSPSCLTALESRWAPLQFQGTAQPAMQPAATAPIPTAETALSQEAKAFAEQVKQVAQGTPSKQTEPDEDFDSTNTAAFDLANVDPEMLQDFLTNADELMEKLSQSILDLENDPNNKESIEQIFRTAHTIKGTAGMFGFKATERLTHVMENMFDKVRKGQLVASSYHIDAILFGFDRVRKMFEELKQQRSPELKINDALQQLHAALRGEAPSKNPASGESAPPSAEPTAAPSTPEMSAKPTGEGQSPKEPQTKGTAQPKGEGTIRVDLRRLDSLVNLVGELVIDRTRFLEIEEELRARSENGDLLHAMSEAVLHFGRHMNEVQGIIMKIRMVPVGNTLSKFTRVVRDLARDCGKEVELNIEGGDAELDKTLVEELHDPLVHLIRNSVDHGIEPPDVRTSSGKGRKGRIDIVASQDSNMIVIKLQDDGRGLQVDRIRSKAIQQGIISENDGLTNKEIFNLIFEAGFSTAEKVTNISGRGVGMDVVKKSILRLKGVIDIDSTPGHGTTTTIKLPLTLAIIPSLMIDCMGESYAIPLVNVVESIRITPEEIQRIGSADFVRLRDRALPLFRMSEIFDLNNLPERVWYKTTQDSSLNSNRPKFEDGGMRHSSTLQHRTTMEHRSKRPRIIFVVVGVGEKRIGIIVDQLMGQQEIVIKSLGSILGKPRGISGGCVLGNGRVALVLDAGEIVDDVSRGRIGGAS
jgi:two-component system chemotaxis sensor kinase CheA